MVKQRYVELFLQFVLADFKLRYKNSLLGITWSVLKPFLLFLIYYTIFALFIKIEIENYPFFLLSGIILWNFVVEGTTNGMLSLVHKAHIIKKIYFPRSIVVAAACTNAFLILLLNLLIFFIFMIFFDIRFSFLFFLIFLILLFLFFFFIFGLSLILAILYVKMRDFSHIWEIFLQILFWLSPIVYMESLIPKKILPWYYFNPFAGFLHITRSLLLKDILPNMYITILTIFITLVLLFSGYVFFRKYVGNIIDDL